MRGEEVDALILSLAIARAMPWMPFAAGADGALAKIEGALPRPRAEELQRFMQRVLVDDPWPTPPKSLGPIDPALVGVFERAFTAGRRLSFGYVNAAGRDSHRTVEPHGLLIRAPLWYVIAWDPEIDAPRLFRADRMREACVDESAFLPRPHDLVTGACPDAQAVAGPS